MNQLHRKKLAEIYNTLATLVPVPSEEYSTKHAMCLSGIRQILRECAEQQKEASTFD